MGEMFKQVPVPFIHPDNAQPMGRSVQAVARPVTSEKSAEAGEIQWSIT